MQIHFNLNEINKYNNHSVSKVALAEWLRRVPAKYMGFARESSNLSGDDIFFLFSFLICVLFYLSGGVKRLLQRAFSRLSKQ